jgi:transcription antitermination factor NusG
MVASCDEIVRPWRYVARGDDVRIESGPLRGVTGLLISEPTKRRLIVSILLLRRSIAVELDDTTMLIPISSNTNSSCYFK